MRQTSRTSRNILSPAIMIVKWMTWCWESSSSSAGACLQFKTNYSLHLSGSPHRPDLLAPLDGESHDDSPLFPFPSHQSWLLQQIVWSSPCASPCPLLPQISISPLLHLNSLWNLPLTSAHLFSPLARPHPTTQLLWVIFINAAVEYCFAFFAWILPYKPRKDKRI